MSSYRHDYADPVPCACCGGPVLEGGATVGIPDDAGHLWTSTVCGDCDRGCTSDDDGRPAARRADAPHVV